MFHTLRQSLARVGVPALRRTMTSVASSASRYAFFWTPSSEPFVPSTHTHTTCLFQLTCFLLKNIPKGLLVLLQGFRPGMLRLHFPAWLLLAVPPLTTTPLLRFVSFVSYYLGCDRGEQYPMYCYLTALGARKTLCWPFPGSRGFFTHAGRRKFFAERNREATFWNWSCKSNRR